ncbi:MAG TPA: TlpA family protein disulfide reductase, partial [Flavobacteriaceae bacterium]|nr:TlpA family protein disulfide reductase [Flavobacteriaceae bacterium]
MGYISNSEVKNIDITRKGFDKRIKVNSDGTFSDTVKIIKKGYHTFNDGENKILIHIKNGDVLNFEYDYSNFSKTVAFSGVGFETTAYLNKRKKLYAKEGINNPKLFFKLEPDAFKDKVKRVEDKLNKILEPKGIDSLLKAKELSRNTKLIAYLKQNYAKEYENLARLAKGSVSPKFIGYENYNGGKTSLDDFKGNFVYIDVWATWCGPCKREIPHLKTLEDTYKNKKIKFVSISLDNGRGYKNDVKKAKEAWKSMIKGRNMKGVQLYADKA